MCRSAAMLLAFGVSACPRFAVELEGRPCSDDDQCLAPYICDLDEQICVIRSCSDEICDGLDNDCDDQVDEDFPTEMVYPDADDDGHGRAGAEGSVACIGLLGVARVADDCDDSDSTVHPGADDRVGDGVDQNCDGLDGVDRDGDHVASQDSGGSDCDDSVATCDADCATDFDLDGVMDCADPCIDFDGDGHGAPGAGLLSTCQGDDCDDVHATCVADCETDDDGDLLPDCRDECIDADGDGYGRAGEGCLHSEVDCDDLIGNASDLDADNVCNGDDNCWAIANPGQRDTDADCGSPPYVTDPGCGDICDPCIDADRDGYGWAVVSPSGCVDVDCDDSSAARNYGEVEICDGVDNDCDLRVDEDLWVEDDDFDAICNALDVCRAVHDTPQLNHDEDCPAGPYGSDPVCGDACEDSDGDGVIDLADNCPGVANAGQEDADSRNFRLLVQDTFDSGTGAWTFAGPGSWTNASGTLRQTSNEGENHAVRGSFQLPDDFVMWFGVNPDDDDLGGLMFGYQDFDNFYGASFHLNNDWQGNNVTFVLERKVAGVRETLAVYDLLGAGVTETGWYSMGVVKQGDRATFIFDWNRDGQWEIVGGANIGPLPGRSIALLAWVQQGIRFDNVSVAELGPVDLAGDACDVCPNLLDRLQSDCDGDGAGDACDSEADDDGDSIANACDVCWSVADPEQSDTDLSCQSALYVSDPTCGDACSDTDSDGVFDADDNCPTVPNANQNDSEGASLSSNTLPGGHPPAWLFLGPWETGSCLDRGSIYREWLSAFPVSAGVEVAGRRWRRVSSSDGVYDWLNVFSDWGTIRGSLDGTHGYASVWFHLDADRFIYLRVGADDAARVAIDGSKVIDKATCSGMAADQAVVGTWVTAGWHRLLVRVTNHDASHGHVLRFTDAAGNGLSLATTTEPPHGDGVGDACDLCPGHWNPDGLDHDSDGVGDRCDRCGVVPGGAEADSDGDCPSAPYWGDPRCGDSCDQP